MNSRPPIAASPRPPFHVMAKPIGPLCNLGCKYCFYLEKESLYSGGQWRMSPQVLESYIRQYIESQDTPEIAFAWQGGEPTLLGVEFFEQVVSLQQKYAGGRRITNALQTNGTLLDDRWCELLAGSGFLVGLSIDGPRHLHDTWRVDKQNRPSFDAVLRGLEALKRHAVEFNTLTVVSRTNSQHPLEVYHFLKQIGSQFLQFIPLVERLGSAGGTLAEAPDLTRAAPPLEVAPWAVEPAQYGRFLSDIFDYWVRHDVGRVFVQLFDVSLGIWAGQGASLCVFSPKCGRAAVLEHNGDVYSCDHFVYPNYRLGNLLTSNLHEMIGSTPQVTFGHAKSARLPQYCRRCDVRFACNGECPKHRFLTTPDGEPGLNYLCAGYRHFFSHIDPHMKTMAGLLQSQRAPAEIMAMLARQAISPGRIPSATAPPGRNTPCPCGSGRKFKKCCGA